jgi:hypothetical protein
MAAQSSRGVRRERGQSMVEFALVLPVVLLLIFGLLEFGRVVNAEISAGHCANELARFAVVGHSIEEVRNYAYQTPICPTFNLDPATTPGNLLIEIDLSYPGGSGTGAAVIVTMAYPIEIVVPIIQEFFPGGIFTAHGRATLQMEQIPAP